MATNLGIDEKLLAEAFKLGRLRTKRETVNEALREFIGKRERMRVIELFGTVEYDPDYDHKKQRQRR